MRAGKLNISGIAEADTRRSLIELGWLAPERRVDRDAVTGAIVALATLWSLALLRCHGA